MSTGRSTASHSTQGELQVERPVDPLELEVGEEYGYTEAHEPQMRGSATKELVKIFTDYDLTFATGSGQLQGFRRHAYLTLPPGESVLSHQDKVHKHLSDPSSNNDISHIGKGVVIEVGSKSYTASEWARLFHDIYDDCEWTDNNDDGYEPQTDRFEPQAALSKDDDYRPITTRDGDFPHIRWKCWNDHEEHDRDRENPKGTTTSLALGYEAEEAVHSSRVKVAEILLDLIRDNPADNGVTELLRSLEELKEMDIPETADYATLWQSIREHTEEDEELSKLIGKVKVPSTTNEDGSGQS